MIRQTSTRTAYKNPWMTVREDTTQLPDGSAGLYGVVDKPDFAAVVPLHADGTLQLVEQYRYPVGKRLWEIPQGIAAANSPEDQARAELVEETGLLAGTMTHIGHFHAVPGFCSQGYDLYLATDLRPGTLAREHTEQDMQTAAKPLSEVLDLIESGNLTCAVSIAALGLLRLRGHL